MRLTSGSRLGPYEVLSTLGSGGMAEVYRARDTRLGREVALKVVNEALAGDPDLVRRFEQEARLAGSLNHPNLVAVYDVGVQDGAAYFITELLKGESLRERLSHGRIPIQTALDWGAQLAQGLAAAHAQGIIHRDVKPENVFVTSDGHVKLLDFGIAKLTEQSRVGGRHGILDDTVTPIGGATQTGAILGTPAYMSPEQVRGESVDARTDIFSLGAVLHEMLSGQRPFPGSPLESSHAILNEEPPPLPDEVPAVVARVVQRCLAKEPARRLQSASDLGFALEILRSPTGTTQPAVAPSRARRRIGWTVAALAAVALMAAAFAAGRHGSARPVSLPEVEPITFRWGGISGARFLPDGRVVYSGSFEGRPGDLFVRPSGSPSSQSLGVQDARLVSASTAGELAVILHPDWTYGGRGTLAQVPSVGGVPRELAEDVLWAEWSPGGELAVLRTEGANSTLEFPPGHVIFKTTGGIGGFRFSPRGERIAFVHHPIAGDSDGEVLVTDLLGQVHPWSQGVRDLCGLAWSADGSEIWFAHGGKAGWRTNLLSSVGPGGATRDIYRSISPFCLFDVARDGQVLVWNGLARLDLVYAGDGSGPQTLLSWSDWNEPVAALSAEGKVLFSTAVENSKGSASVVLRSTTGAPAQILGDGYAMDLSADGRWALVVSSDWTRLTAVPTGAGKVRSIPTGGLVQIRAARWMPDGKDVLVVGHSAGESHLRLHRVTGDASLGGPIGEATLRLGPLHLSRDGRWAAALDEDSRPVIISVRDGSTRPVPRADAGVLVPRGWAPDGSLWVSAAEPPLAQARLLRLDPESGKVLQERTLRPADPGGSSALREVVLSPDGRQVAFSYVRWIASLAILRGLER
jgi:serine/threonine protein kinase